MPTPKHGCTHSPAHSPAHTHTHTRAHTHTRHALVFEVLALPQLHPCVVTACQVQHELLTHDRDARRNGLAGTRHTEHGTRQGTVAHIMDGGVVVVVLVTAEHSAQLCLSVCGVVVVDAAAIKQPHVSGTTQHSTSGLKREL